MFVLLLPPYSPDLSPIEDLFSMRSSWLRRWVSSAQYVEWPMLSIDSMLGYVTGEMCTGLWQPPCVAIGFTCRKISSKALSLTSPPK